MSEHRWLLSLLAVCLAIATGFTQTELAEGFVRTLVAEGLNPTSMVQAPDGRIFVAQKDGRISVIRNDQLLDEPFATIQVDAYNERGLGHIALHPNFEQNNHVYAFYSVEGTNTNRIIRLTANGDLAIPGSEEIIFETDELRSAIHNGGSMFFGSDGMLYISTGEGNRSYTAKNLNSVLGKILRINADGTIPEDNPFYDELSGDARAIWAYGFRNPFSMAYDAVNDRLYANDVGGERHEEINLIVKGGFYGWDDVEGYRTDEEVPAHYKDPLYAYSHSQGCAIVGSDLYYPEMVQLPEEYLGMYLFADYCEGWIKVLDPSTGEVVSILMKRGDRIVDIMTAADGSVYYLERRGIGDGSPQDNSGTVDGLLWKIEYSGDGSPHISRHPGDVFASVGETAMFSVDATGMGALDYSWWKDDQLIDDAASETLELDNVQLSDSNHVIRCRVMNEVGEVWSDSAHLFVTSNKRPIITFVQPASAFLYRAGEEISFEATVMDPEDGAVDSDDITWWVDFHHRDHVHPGVGFQNGQPIGSFEVPVTGEIDTEVWYRIYVYAKDSRGLEQTSHVDIFPELTSFEVSSDPPGLEISVDGSHRPTPFVVESVTGIQRTLEAPENQVQEDQIFFFEQWDTGGDERIVSLTAGAQESVTAGYRSRTLGQGAGLRGRYFNSPDHTGTAVLERIDTTIDHNFYFDAPHESLPEDMFSIRWEGYILPYESGNYNLIGISNDGMRLWINDELIFESWDIQSSVQLAGGKKFLNANTLYKVRVDYFEYNWGASCQLKWSTDDLREEVIPKSQLYPALDGHEFDIVISPNPAFGENVTVTIRSDLAGVVPCRVIDITGREVASFDIGLIPGETTQTLPITLIPGVYFMEMLSAGSEIPLQRFVAH